jgi:benzil reductase ((S)-benzoin forming)
MNKHLSIVTGASRGMGLALAEQLLASGHQVLAISRHTTPLVAPPGSPLESWPMDLADAAPVAQRLALWLSEQAASQPVSVTLINNAGVISKLAPLSASEEHDLANALRVGLEAPMLLTAAFLRATQAWTVPRKVLLISSGLGRRAMAGSASYCAAKAGMDHLARAVALEEARHPHGARVVSLAPGVIETDMQVQLRGADAALFPDRKNFIAMKEEGRLDSPAAAASKLINFLARVDFGSNPVADVRDA